MKNIALCFDQSGEQSASGADTNIKALLALLDDSAALTRYHCARKLPVYRRVTAVSEARTAVVEAYNFLRDAWKPGDRIFLFGAGTGGHLAGELANLLGTVGLVPATFDDPLGLVDYALSTYVLPRTPRTISDWHRVSSVTAGLLGDGTSSVLVRFLGLWDATAIPGTHGEPGLLTNVEHGRHAVAIDAPHRVMHHDARLDEVWFRGSHCDVPGGHGACAPLAEIALDWVLDGAVAAGLPARERDFAPGDVEALAGSSPTVGIRRLPFDARVHASVGVYLRSHPKYWRRFPARIEWADTEWSARGERLASAISHTPATEEATREELTAVAS
ncbi:DUF2235 domain-containing protein [Mycolicibacterium smegmatis]|uniref:phospholipase effector Tle1 domain-containing protein n=1 Tax=Mycolicibacterium smegmatis TaxID=1772 RepID=UPI001E4DC8FE|nr:DUF2235 domain-containing protein [Mycolicibacterium smegmatis]UGU30681.1 DUF2235 domain-containing protein [Mycolicibacterium smegmatis]ULN71594.1 DUF2235 domain-containing protein [Mycolicibacterium smegmatis]